MPERVDDIDDASVEAAELGGDVVGFDGEFLDVVEDGEEGNLSGFGLEGGDAVVEILVGAWASAVDARKQGSGRKFDAGGERSELHEVAGIERHGDDDGMGDVGLDITGGGLQQGQVAGDQ